jgi:hypothetical protein
MKNKLVDKYLSVKSNLQTSSKMIASFKFSFIHGLTAFFALLFALALIEIVENVVFGKSSKIFDHMDFAMAGLGFVLMFLAKFFEGLSGKR